MKQVIFIALLILLLVGCKNQYEHEDKICDCYRNELTKKGENFDELIISLENYFVEMGLLLSADGEAYYQNIEMYIADPFFSYPHGIDENARKRLELLLSLKMSLDCEMISFDELSKLKELRIQFEELNGDNLSLSAVWSIYHRVLTKNDFDHAFYKAEFFLMTYLLSPELNEFGGQLPLKIKDENRVKIDVDPRNTLEIEVSAQDSITVNELPVKIEDLKAHIFSFYTNNRNGENKDESMPKYTKVNSELCLSKINELELSLAKDPTEIAFKFKKNKWQTKLEICMQIPKNEFIEMDKSAIIKLSNCRGTSYGLYIEIQNSLKQVVNELRQEKCEEMNWGNYFDLDQKNEEDEEIIKMLRILVPERILESEIEC